YIEYYNTQRIVLKNKTSPVMYRQLCLQQLK
ncbi:MAG: IS3 family transposase, partial [Clostridia bacterium]|nr:IS3 family transposase [Clostridia bacterium]